MQRGPTSPDDVWLLALAHEPPRLTCFLTDSASHFEHVSSPWPPAPAAASALPAALLRTLADSGVTQLRLQLDPALDACAWEAELERACPGICVTRHARRSDGAPQSPVALPPPEFGLLGSDSRDDPFWVHGTDSGQALHSWLAEGASRPLLLMSSEATSDEARSFRLQLHARWEPGLALSRAAVQAASDCGIPRRLWRQYGDAPFTLGSSEQELRQVTTMNIDLVGSTTLLHAWGAERYAEDHGSFYRLCRRIVEGHGGRLDDDQGDDGLMAYFGLLRGQEEAAAQAVRAAWALTQEAPSSGFSVRIGIATGKIPIRDGLPFGEEVHLAARLQTLAATNGIVLSDGTQELLGSGAMCERLPGEHLLKGFPRPVVAYRLVRLPEPRAAARQRHLQGRFVGRHQELATLMAAWTMACMRRRGQYQCLLGEPGMGKTRLLQEFGQTLRRSDQPVTVLSVTGQVQTQASAFSALRHALQGPAFEDLARLLQPLATPGGEAPEHERQSERHEILNQLVAGFLALARRAPLCCIVDDAQWLDPSSVELVERLRLQSSAVPLLLVVSLRQDARSLGRGLHTLHAMTLGGLNLDESVDLIDALSASLNLPPQLCETIAGRAGGVPLFLEETVRMVEHHNGDLATLAQGIPATLEDLLTARLDALGDAKALVQLAAVLGTECSASLWHEVLAEPDEWIQRAQVPGAWQRVLDSGMLRLHEADGPRFRFKHALIRDAAYQSVWIRDRKRLHAVAARVLERSPAEAGAELRAHHLAAAGELDAAFAAWTLAARHAAAAAADREALALSQRALALLPDLPDTPQHRQQALQLHLLQAARHIALDGYGANSVEAAYLRAATLCGDGDEGTMRTRVELGLEACYAMRGDLARARTLAEAAVSNTSWDKNLRLALQARWAWTNVVFHQGDLRSALDMADECLARYHPALHQPGAVQDPGIMFLCYSAWGMFERGCAGEARKRVQRLLALAETLEHPFSHAVAHGFAASVALFCGDHQAGLHHAEEAMRRCTAKAFQAWLAHAQVMRGRLRAAVGEIDAGLADMEQGLALWTATGARITGATYLAFQAEILLEVQQPQMALQKLVLAKDMARHHGERYYEAELLRLQGWAQWQLRSSARDAEAAQALLLAALERAREQGRLGYALRSAVALGRTWAELGQHGKAAALAQEALQAVPDHQVTIDARNARQALHLWAAGHQTEQGREGKPR
jgi:class 3 adenylate cyclase/tetratricopeptide (TPR) repeat protein